MINLEEIRKIVKGKILINEPLAKYSTFKIGGPADLYIEPKDVDELLRLIRYLKEKDIDFVILGNGSNVLISDAGFRGAVINLEAGLNFIRVEGECVIAGAGVKLAKFVDFCIENGFRGVEMLAGIPGTLGGAIVMNAGAYSGEISDYLIDVDVIRNLELIRLNKEDCGFGYRTSGLTKDVIVQARFKFPYGDVNEMRRVRREILIKRNQTQPVNFPNAGSIFKNPPGNYAGKLIEEAGLKGVQIGDAQISEKHANFIINKGNATASDVLELIKLIQDKVYEKFGIKLELEVRLIGFKEEEIQNLV
ncbi:UDP-N-acetylmuramate dehydrogenase [Candidatus Kryptobacter tengchongensis]|uniref:UDP-N-acetylenolpyruvoylglucosamine reductase n=1 Tax=Kryptobacter tengchongensis TaxID=1643429 RepID=A0A656CZX0_KRYT1|nr:UDP-N-acetylmuramate dehydrogenase [Candidatus Kryptobacter tengchongensis]CUS87715.1 UDP-N-acetylmuramate dehydrogenase [Candidatus Kryptobacter tengchongensis]CUT01848.1 UDP-N-acetylmuramate dehydrogenase [Candidatus Kryptobacter tengchongensis]CUU09482.1 UDP-N-acetylmuramate dehydrogenase [Candidatus Kryptobacter tengchongensis]